MADLERFDLEEQPRDPFSSYRDMRLRPDGDWVRFEDVATLRGVLASSLRESAELIAQRDTALGALKAEHAAHEETRRALAKCEIDFDSLSATHESTRTELATARARLDKAETVLPEGVLEQWRTHTSDFQRRIAKAAAAYRAATAPVPRSRAEVDAEMAGLVREICAASEAAGSWGIGHRTLGHERRITDLCREATSGPSDESAGIPPTAPVAGATFRDLPSPMAEQEPEPCGCESEVALRAKLDRIRKVCAGYQVSTCAGEVLRILDEP